jgi:GNAT superfamily N-acetyltransferase
LTYPEMEGTAEVAFITAEEFRNRGIATYLLKVLIRMAREQGIESFFAEVLRENRGMLKVFGKAGVPLEVAFKDGLHHVTLDLTKECEDPDGHDGRDLSRTEHDATTRPETGEPDAGPGQEPSTS